MKLRKTDTKAGAGRFILLATLGAAAVLSSAYAVDFPLAGGDLASDGADGWDGTKPGTSDVVGIVNAGTYTASEDVSFGSMTLTGAGVLLDLSSPTSGKVSLNATSGKAIGFLGHNNSAEIRGGFYSLNGAGVATCAGWDASRYNNLLISGGAVITNAGAIDITYGNIGTNTGIRLVGGSRLHSKTGAVTLSQGTARGCHIEVTDGSEFYAAGNFRTALNNPGFASSNRVLVTGAGSRFYAGSMYAGGSQRYLRFRIEDHATARVNGTVRLGYAGGSSMNRLEVDSGASLSFTTLYLGGGDSGTNTPGGTNTVSITDGASVTMSGGAYIGGYLKDTCSSYNEIVVSNASFSCSKVNINFQSNATHNVFRLIGKDTVFTVTHSGLPYYVFGKGGYGLFEMDAASWTYNLNQLYFGYEAHDAAYSSPGNVMRLKNGASLHLDKDMMIGTRAAASVSNRLEVLSGSSVVARNLFLTSADNSIVVSNGAISCTTSLTIGYEAENAVLITNGTLAVQGETPEIAVTNAVTIINGSTLRFELPTSGTSYAKAPITAKTFRVDGTSSLVVDANAFAAAVRAAPNPTKAVLELVRTTDGVTVPADVLARANTGLPERCALKVAEGGNVLKLVVPANVGFVIVVH